MSTDAQGFPLRDVIVATANLPPMQCQITKLEKAMSLLVSLHQTNNWVIQLPTWSQTHNERIFSPHPTTQKLNTAAICCQGMLAASTSLRMEKIKKINPTTHDCINNKCQYLTKMMKSFSRWLVIILLTQFFRRPAGVGFGHVDSESRTQKPRNITSRKAFGKCSPLSGS